MKLSVRELPEAIAVRFYADFDVKIQPKEISQLTRR
ncbi:hypothetical protein SAMN05443244_0554 [Terriglobus roseus]|uniref:Uncharacterized protein n=1 Tax=Terriglobus roseus TaxID=392734 RepID=A0A1H4JED2_9BACT|nr:hypothetical protein SAMN05443244_0554 [Terriglobus roseus]